LREIRTPAFNVPIMDSTGCGDAYNAGFIKGLSLGWDLERCAWLGCACGGLVVQGLGSDAGLESFESTVNFAKMTPTRPTKHEQDGEWRQGLPRDKSDEAPSCV
jgi:sugar/nucleoside kinase (ribokinase family)